MKNKILLNSSFLLIVATATSSCGSVFRHNFRSINREEAIKVMGTIKETQSLNPQEILTHRGRAYIENRVVHQTKENDIYCWNENYLNEEMFDWSEDENYIKISSHITGLYASSRTNPFVRKQDEKYFNYIVKDGNKIYRAFSNENTKEKYKYDITEKFNKHYSSFRNCLISLMNGKSEYALNPMYYDPCSRLAGTPPLGSELFSNGYIYPDITGINFLGLWQDNDRLKHYDESKGPNIHDYFGSNDNKSISVTIKGNQKASNYVDMINYHTSSKPHFRSITGDVYLDWFYALEENFLSQMEFRTSYDVAFKDAENKNLVCKNETYIRGSVKLKAYVVEKINLNDFITKTL